MKTPDPIHRKRIKDYAAILRTVKFMPFNDAVGTRGVELVIDDKTIRMAIQQLALIGSDIPSPREFEASSKDAHFILPVVESNRILLYWFVYLTSIGDRGYSLFRIADCLDGAFNFEDFGESVGLDLESTIQSVFTISEQVYYLLIDFDLGDQIQPVVKPGFIGLMI